MTCNPLPTPNSRVVAVSRHRTSRLTRKSVQGLAWILNKINKKGSFLGLLFLVSSNEDFYFHDSELFAIDQTRFELKIHFFFLVEFIFFCSFIMSIKTISFLFLCVPSFNKNYDLTVEQASWVADPGFLRFILEQLLPLKIWNPGRFGSVRFCKGNLSFQLKPIWFLHDTRTAEGVDEDESWFIPRNTQMTVILVSCF